LEEGLETSRAYYAPALSEANVCLWALF
jgi:hypothetical protein